MSRGSRASVATTLSRLGVSSLSVALLLGLVQQRGSVRLEAGAALAAFGAGLAAAAPFTARLTDRHPPRRVLALADGLHGLALAE